MDDIYLNKRMKPIVRDALNKQVWFAGLYIASLIFLTATGASVRWVLAAI